MTIVDEIVEFLRECELEGDDLYCIEIPTEVYDQMCKEENVSGVIEINGVTVNVI